MLKSIIVIIACLWAIIYWYNYIDDFELQIIEKSKYESYQSSPIITKIALKMFLWFPYLILHAGIVITIRDILSEYHKE